MKEIYQILNEVEIDEKEIEELENMNMETTELEKAAVKKRLRKAIQKNRRYKTKGVAAAVLVGGITMGVLGIGIYNPTYAAQVPIVGDIFRFLDHGRTGAYDLYKENAHEINVTKASNGVSITIKDAVFDGKTLFYTYEIKTDKDLGAHPLMGADRSLRIKGYTKGLTGSSRVEKVDPETYVGTDHYTIDENKDQINCKLDIKDILLAETDKEDTVKGEWQFEFELKAVETEKQVVDQSVEKDGFKLSIKDIAKTPMSNVISFIQEVPEEYRGEMDNVYTVLEVKDNLGNVYDVEDNGMHGNDKTGKSEGTMTIGKINNQATQLIITPKIICSTYKGGVSIDEDGAETQIQPVDKPDKEVKLKDIVITLNK